MVGDLLGRFFVSLVALSNTAVFASTGIDKQRVRSIVEATIKAFGNIFRPCFFISGLTYFGSEAIADPQIQ